MVSLKLVFGSLRVDIAMASSFLLVLSTDLIFVTPVASGTAGRANVGLCPAYSYFCFSCCWDYGDAAIARIQQRTSTNCYRKLRFVLAGGILAFIL